MKQHNSVDDASGRKLQLRAISVYEKRPERARNTDCGTAEVHAGLACTYEQDGHRVSIDMPSTIGGGGQAPKPGYFGRAAICSCLAIGIKLTAVRQGLRLQAVRVGIEQDWDDRGIFAMNGANPAPLDTRISIEIASHESRGTLDDLVTRALECDPWFLSLRDAQPVSTTITVNTDEVM